MAYEHEVYLEYDDKGKVKMVIQSSTQQKRISWIDVVKGIGICLVVMGHVYRSNPVLIWIYSFHMPLFFILSGWLRESKKKQIEWKSFIQRKLESFIVPLLIFLLLTFLYWIAVESHFREFEIGPMWFLPVLFFAEVVSEIIIDYTNEKLVRGGVLLSGILLYICSKFIDASTVMAWIPRCLGALTYYLFGVAMAELIPVRSVKEKVSRYALVCIVGVSVVLSIILSQVNGRVDLYFLIFGKRVLYFICAIAGSSFIYGVAILIGKCRSLEFLGRYSII